MRRAVAAAGLAGIAMVAGAQSPSLETPAVRKYVDCVVGWALVHAHASATAFEVADAALDACPLANPGTLQQLEPSDTSKRMRAYARSQALVTVVEVRTPRK